MIGLIEGPELEHLSNHNTKVTNTLGNSSAFICIANDQLHGSQICNHYLSLVYTTIALVGTRTCNEGPHTMTL